MYASYYDAIKEASSKAIGPTLPDFEHTFAPVPPPPNDKWLDFVVQLLSLGIGAVTKPLIDGCKCQLLAFLLLDGDLPGKYRYADSKML